MDWLRGLRFHTCCLEAVSVALFCWVCQVPLVVSFSSSPLLCLCSFLTCLWLSSVPRCHLCFEFYLRPVLQFICTDMVMRSSYTDTVIQTGESNLLHLARVYSAATATVGRYATLFQELLYVGWTRLVSDLFTHMSLNMMFILIASKW